MKRLLKTALALVVAGGGLIASGSAFAFPEPYCVRNFVDNIEPISRVKIADINNTSTNATNAPPTNGDEDFTLIIGNLHPGSTYAMSAEGNSDGNFTNLFRAYIDWNHDGLFNEDASERYELGSITNSTGLDGKTTGTNILIPVSAITGNTRMRVVKKYSSAGAACDGTDAAGTSYGQAEDYTVNVDPIVVPPPAIPSLAKSFSPTNGDITLPTTLTLSLGQLNAAAASLTLTANLVDTLPTGMTVAATPSESTTCPSGTVTAVPAASTITLGTGAQIPPAGCTVTVKVQVATVGVFTNSIPAGALQTDAGNYGAIASATYTSTSPGVVTYSAGFETPTFVVGNLAAQGGWGRSGGAAADLKVSTANPGAGLQELRVTWATAGTGTVTAISPTQGVGTTTYAIASAKLAINQNAATNGTEWDFTPQDPGAGFITTRVRFLRPTLGVNKIQVLDPNAGGPGVSGFVDTGSSWTAGTYFDLKVISNRAAQTSVICINGAAISTVNGFAKNIANIAITGTKGTGTNGNTLDVDAVVIDNSNIGTCNGLPPTYTVTPSVGTGSGTITPAIAQIVNENGTIAFTLAAAPFFHIDTVGGTCGGTLAGAVFTTAAVTADCTVIANFAANPAPTLSKTFTPASVLTEVNSVATITLSNPTASPAVLTAPLTDTLPTGLTVVSATTTCGIVLGRPQGGGASVGLPAGVSIPANGSCTLDIVVKASLAGSYVNTLAAGALQTNQGNNVAAASATLTVAPATFTVTPSVGTPSGSISPATVQTVATGATTSFVLTPNPGFHINDVAGTCGGSLVGNTFTTAPATADCTVIADFAVGDPFPAPYCPVTFPSNVEPISRVLFSGIDNASSPLLNGTPPLEDFLLVAGGDVTAGMSYPIAVEGNTDGGFTAKLQVFVDWNQDGVFGAGENSALSDLVNSTGTDGQQSTGTIVVPPTALGGPTRMRVIKKFNTAPTPCNSAGYGQAEDYTLNVTAETGVPIANVSPASFDFTVAQGSTGTDTLVIGNTGTATLTYDIKRALAAREAQAASRKAHVLARNAAQIRINDAAKAAMSGEVPMPQALNLLSAYGGFPPITSGILASDPACDSSVTGMITHDHGGAPDNGYGWNASAGADARMADKFTPTSYPATFSTVCVTFLTNTGLTAVPVKIIVYADDGVGGSPGTLLGSVDVTANNITSALAESFQAFDISSMNLSIASGSVYIGVQWDATSISGLFVGADETSAPAGGYSYTTADGAWSQTEVGQAGYKSLYVRAVEGAGGPPGVGCDAPSNVSWLTVSPAIGTVAPMSSKNVALTINPATLAVGNYSGLLCVNTNDATNLRIEVPVTLEVTPAPPVDLIFKDGFDGSGGGANVVTGTINQAVTADGDGSSFDFALGNYHPYSVAITADDINLYTLGAPAIAVYWYGDAVPAAFSALVGGVVATPGGTDFKSLHSGDSIGPSSPVSAASSGADMSAFQVGGTSYIGVAFYNETTAALNFGYLHVTTSAGGFPIQVLDYGYNNVGAAITIP